MDETSRLGWFISGFLIGGFIICVVYSEATTHWLSPKIINEKVFYWGKDYSKESNPDQYWVVTKAKIVDIKGSINKQYERRLE